MKKRNMKVLALLMTVTMAGTMLAGCGDSGSTSTGSSGGATASSSGTADASSDATAASSSTADASSEDTTGSDDVVGELPRNETLYFAVTTQNQNQVTRFSTKCFFHLLQHFLAVELVYA